jgi:AcrR family transcriptional regulator
MVSDVDQRRGSSGAPARRHTDQGLERKQQLLDAAEALFAGRGYGPTRIADICETAGVAKGLFYWYFENKESLFAELVRSVRQQLRRAQAAAMDDGADPVTRLRQGTEASVRFMAEHGRFFALLEVERHDQRVAAVLRESGDVYVQDAARIVRQAQAAGLVPDDHDATLLAIGVLGAVSQFSHYHRTGRLKLSIDELAAFVVHWTIQALAAVPRPAPSSIVR